MAFNIPTPTELKERLLGLLAIAFGRSDPLPDHANAAIFGKVVAGQVSDLHVHGGVISQEILPDTAVDTLDRHGAIHGVVPRPATHASGGVSVIGTPGYMVPEGARLQYRGVSYRVTAASEVGGGTAIVMVEAEVSGMIGNLPAGAVVTFVNPVSGVSSEAVAVDVGGGVDVEDIESFRERILFRRRYPPQGGADHDYVAWAKEVPGVRKAWPYPEELGRGTVTVRIATSVYSGGPIPPEALVAAVASYIERHDDPVTGVKIGRPVGAEVVVVAPIAKPLGLLISLSPDTPESRSAVEAQIDALLERDAAPGAPIYISRLREAVSLAPGEHHHLLVEPIGEVIEHAVGEIATRGPINWG